MGPGSFPVVSSNRTRGNGPRWKHRGFPQNIKQRFFYCEGDGALAQVTQNAGGVSIHGHIQKQSGHDPGQPAVGDLA